MKTRPFSTMAAATVTLFIASCSSLERNSAIVSRADTTLDAQQRQIQKVRELPSKTATPTVQYLTKPWVELKSIQTRSVQVPKALRCNLTVATREPISLLEFREMISKRCQVNVRVTNDALVAVGAIAAAMQTSAQTTGGAMPAPNYGYGQQHTPAERMIDLNYKGDLRGLMDLAMGRFGVSWKEDGPEQSELKIYSIDTATFYLKTIALDVDMSSEMFSGTTMVNGASGNGMTGSATGGPGSGSSTSGNGSSGTSQDMKVNVKTSIWNDIRSTIQSMVTKKEMVAVSPSTGAITVTDNADVIARVKSYIDRENRNLLKQVSFHVTLVSITQNRSDNVGFSLDALYQTLSGKYGLNLVSGTGPVDGSNSATFSVLKGSGSNWGGSSAVIDALSQLGTVSVKRNPSITALNLRPAGLQVAKQDGYIIGSSTTSTAQVGSTNALQAGLITTGFNMSVLPYILENNDVLLQFSVNLSSLDGLRIITQSNSYAELPKISQPINSAQGVKLSAGDVLMLSGFDQEDESATNTGTGNPNNWILGGGTQGSKMRSSLILLISPVVME